MKVVVVGDLTVPGKYSGDLISRLANLGVDVVYIKDTSITETIAAFEPDLSLTGVTTPAPTYYTEPETQKPEKGNFRRQFGGTGDRLDRRYK